MVTVAAAVDADLAILAKRDKALSESVLAASARALASIVDNPENSATSRSIAAKELRETFDSLLAMAPPAEEKDELDELNARRAKKRTAAATG